MNWNYGDMFEAIAAAMPQDRPALIHDGHVITWKQMDQRANSLGRRFLQAGARPGDKVAFYMRNHSAYMETLAACFKARLTHVNVNFRYVEDELWYIIDNSDARVVVFAAEFAPQVEALRQRLPDVLLWVQVDDGNPGADFSDNAANGQLKAYEGLATSGNGSALDMARQGDDMLFIYTGGTTGMPKGVMWAQEDIWTAGGAGAVLDQEIPAPADMAEHVANIMAATALNRGMPVCPEMHGTGLLTALGTLARGGTVVTISSSHFDAARVWQTVQDQQVTSMAIVGDAFGRPLLQELDKHPGAYDLSSMVGIISSGVMWSPEIKQGLLRHNPQMTLIDSFGASEAIGFGQSVTTADQGVAVAKFAVGEFTKVFSEDHREILPGSEEPGFVARCGGIPRGYYKDPEKSAKTFPKINGVRYSIPGDWCQVAADGTITLLGRGSVCINTAGEKVYPEEVEEVLKTHPAIKDALVVGVPDEKWGQAVTAAVELADAATLDEVALKAFVRKSLAAYKCPKHVFAIDDLGRAANGKADYKMIGQYVRAKLGIQQLVK
ncbi:MAG: acyl-CoA synthetase [Pseudomonadales bacterium]|nr:acyl-CoA synthetase [Pseudomonadales bacterium]